MLVLTHAQSDHEGAALAVVRRFSPRLVLDGGAGWPTAVQRGLGRRRGAGGRPRRRRPRRPVARPRRPAAAGALAAAAAPGERPDGDPNDRAVVALASAGRFDLLLTADAESDVTLPLALRHVDALKVAHHGSADEGLPLLLRG